MNEEYLISQLKAGDAAAFRELVKLYGDNVYNTAVGLLQHVEDAEDATQEVFTEIFQSVKKFKGESKLSTWIYRIAVSKALEFIRRKNRKKRFAFTQRLFGNDSVLPLHEAPDFFHPGVALENKEMSGILFKAIDKLPENQKTAFVLHKVEGLSYAEIADVMQVSLSSVESLMFRARQNLQKLLRVYYQNR